MDDAAVGNAPADRDVEAAAKSPEGDAAVRVKREVGRRASRTGRILCSYHGTGRGPMD